MNPTEAKPTLSALAENAYTLGRDLEECGVDLTLVGLLVSALQDYRDAGRYLVRMAGQARRFADQVEEEVEDDLHICAQLASDFHTEVAVAKAKRSAAAQTASHLIYVTTGMSV